MTCQDLLYSYSYLLWSFFGLFIQMAMHFNVHFGHAILNSVWIILNYFDSGEPRLIYNENNLN